MSHATEASPQANVMVSGLTASLSEDGKGAPLRRSPRGLTNRVTKWARSPEVKVWARPLFRVVGMAGVLGCVAFLGKRSEEESRYGAPVEIPAEDELFEGVDSPEPSPRAEAEVHLSQTSSAQGEPPPCAEQKKVQGPPAILPDGRIIMNEATLQDFTRLPGVGEARAKSIVELRTRMGKFKNVTDLLRVRGIGWKTLQAMKELLVVDRPAVPEKSEGSPGAPQAENSQGPAEGEPVPGSRG